jgi:hypothetical protein
MMDDARLMRARRMLLAAACCAALLLPAACGGTNGSPPTVTPRPATEVSAPPTRPAGTATPATGSAGPSPTPASQPGFDATATPALTPLAGWRFEPAPIDGAELLVEASNPAQYAVHITSGLPSGCHVFDHTTLTRTGSEMIIEVVNRLPADTTIACTAIYGTHETTVQLGGDFASGATYRVHVNERTIEFTAQ